MNSSASCRATSSAAAIASRGCVGGVQVVGPFNSPGVSETPSRRRIFVCRPDAEDAGDGVRAPHRREPGAPRVPPPGHRRGHRFPDAVLRQRARGTGGFDAGIEQVVAAVLVSPEFLFRAIRTPDRGPPEAGHDDVDAVPADRSGAGLAAVVLPVEPGAGRGAAQGRRRREAARRRRCCRPQALRMLNDRRASSLVRNFALKWLDLDNLDEVVPDPNLFPDVQRPAAAGPGDRDRVVRRERAARGSQRRRPAHGRPHVPQRAARAALRHHVGARTAVPARDARGSAALGPAGQGRDAAADVVRRSHVAGAARRVGHGQADGHAADAAAARRRNRSVHSPRAKRRRRCGRGSRAIARSRAATSATA